MSKKINVTVWNEFIHERTEDAVKAIYPDGIHNAIANQLIKNNDITAKTATLDQQEHGLSDQVLNSTDVLIWWAHVAHDKVDDAIVAKVRERVLGGMGLIVLHSGHFSKIFRTMLGTNCSLKWREIGEKERLWNIAPYHPITQGIGEYFEIPHEEMYGERFDIPEPDQLIFLGWFAGGELFRSGCTWQRGNGKIFYFQPGHETYPIYHQEEVIEIITNAVRWTYSPYRQSTADAPQAPDPIERIDRQ